MDDHHTRQTLHRATNRIRQAWPHALIDAGTRGYSSSDGPGSGDADPTGNAACSPSVAMVWLGDLGLLLVDLDLVNPSQLPSAADQLADDWAHDPRLWNPTVNLTVRLANIAAVHWPEPPRKGTTVNGVTVGERSNLVETCGLCQQPVTGGHADPIRRIDGNPYHGKRCWYTVIRQRQTT